MNLNSGIDAIYVYFDVIQTKLVGDSSVPLLSVVPLRGVFGEMAFKEYSAPVYIPLAKHVFSHNRNVHNGQRRKTCTIFFW